MVLQLDRELPPPGNAEANASADACTTRYAQVVRVEYLSVIEADWRHLRAASDPARSPIKRASQQRTPHYCSHRSRLFSPDLVSFAEEREGQTSTVRTPPPGVRRYMFSSAGILRCPDSERCVFHHHQSKGPSNQLERPRHGGITANQQVCSQQRHAMMRHVDAPKVGVYGAVYVRGSSARVRSLNAGKPLEFPRCEEYHHVGGLDRMCRTSLDASRTF
ncbi:hypothetical protein C2E23DRAFT_831584 [Lenzites betulinus]|nr:hypothetical protein C2E23DRAFT_831584 [Lenzites betulinus]